MMSLSSKWIIPLKLLYSEYLNELAWILLYPFKKRVTIRKKLNIQVMMRKGYRRLKIQYPLITQLKSHP